MNRQKLSRMIYALRWVIALMLFVSVLFVGYYYIFESTIHKVSIIFSVVLISIALLIPWDDKVGNAGD